MRGKASRIALAVLVGYLVNATLIVLTDLFLLRFVPKNLFFGTDFATQCFYEVAAGYLCCVIAKSVEREATILLLALGLLVGAISLRSAWRTEPHWYGLGLLAVWAPLVWLAYAAWSFCSQRARIARDR